MVHQLIIKGQPNLKIIITNQVNERIETTILSSNKKSLTQVVFKTGKVKNKTKNKRRNDFSTNEKKTG